MTAKDFLRQYEDASRRAKRYKDEYEKELEMIDAIRSSLGGSGLPHGNSITREVEDKAIRLSEAANKWRNAEADALRTRQEVFGMIADVDGTEGEILYERYINLKKWEEICVTVQLSWRQVHRLHARGLNIIDKKLA